ncbi:polymorphic toxin type 44 domain-containing protein [Kitasatospora hibisci]|uniref:polymorphic toxin type 44 domain-containing protein n=1 Tax=Kitasatospora hibisci TaxID=3369522 RepID=UPI0037550145
MFGEMKKNKDDPRVKAINESLHPDTSILSSIGRAQSNSNTPIGGLAMWGAQVCPHCDWDHKDILDEMFNMKAKDNYWFEVPGTKKRLMYDIWSNIHYGYVGRAAGISGKTLVDGASKLESWLVGRDDKSDHITMQLGVDLYDRYGDNLTQGQLHNAILGLTVNPDMNVKDLNATRLLPKTRLGRSVLFGVGTILLIGVLLWNLPLAGQWREASRGTELLLQAPPKAESWQRKPDKDPGALHARPQQSRRAPLPAG